MSIIQKNPMEKDKLKDIPQKNKELEDDKPDYQEKITFLVSTVAQAFILTWCLLVLSLGYVKLPNKLFGIDIPDQHKLVLISKIIMEVAFSFFCWINFDYVRFCCDDL